MNARTSAKETALRVSTYIKAIVKVKETDLCVCTCIKENQEIRIHARTSALMKARMNARVKAKDKTL